MRQDASERRQDGVRMASGRRQDNLASGWREDDIKRHGARVNSDVTLLNFLSMQGLLRGPVCSHFPVKTSTKNWSQSTTIKLPPKSWFDMVEDEQSDQDHMEYMAAILLQSADIFSSLSALSTSSVFSEIPATMPELPTYLHLSFDLAFDTSAMVENASRLAIQTQFLKRGA